MPEQLEMKTLAGLAARKSSASRTDAADRDARSRAKAAERNGCFDGFLKTFLGKDKTSGSGKRSESPGASTHDKTTALTRRERQAVRDAMEKTDAENDRIDEKAAAAAEEAAKIIWNLLHPDPLDAGPDAMSGGNSLNGLSDLIAMGGHAGGSSLTGMGLDALAGDAVGDAIETANASAEMNMDAVLASLEELLDGLPRSALRHALAGVSGVNGRYDVFAEVAAALEAKIIESNDPATETDPGRMLSELAMTGDRQNAAATEEFSASLDPESETYETFKRFLRENFPNSSAANLKPKQLEKLFASFSQNLYNINNDGVMQESSWKIGGLAGMAAGNFPKDADLSAPNGGAAAGKDFSWAKDTLETLLHDEFGESGSNGAEKDGSGSEQGGESNFSGQNFSDVMRSSTAQTANAADNPAGMNSMLERMENIERLTEAMKMANRGGVKNLTLQLAPVELGKVLLKVEARDGVVTASLRVEKAEAAAQLSESLDQLRESLRAQGVELGEVDIRQYDFGRAADGGSGSGHDDGRGPGSGGSAGRGRISASDEETEAVNADPGIWQGNGLNLFA